MRFLASILLLSLWLVSCSPQARLNHLLKNHPKLAFKRDTVKRIDTVTILPSAADTIIYYKQTDTVIVKENGVTVKYFYNTKDSTIYVKGERDTIRIIREVPVQVNTFEVKPETRWEAFVRHLKDFIIPLLLGAVVILLILQYRKRPKIEP